MKHGDKGERDSLGVQSGDAGDAGRITRYVRLKNARDISAELEEAARQFGCPEAEDLFHQAFDALTRACGDEEAAHGQGKPSR